MTMKKEEAEFEHAAPREQKHKLLGDFSKQLQTTVIISSVVVVATTCASFYPQTSIWASTMSIPLTISSVHINVRLIVDGTARASNNEKSHKLSHVCVCVCPTNIYTKCAHVVIYYYCAVFIYICAPPHQLLCNLRSVGVLFVVRCARTIVMHFLLKFNDSRSNEFRASRINYNVYGTASGAHAYAIYNHTYDARLSDAHCCFIFSKIS